MSAIVLPKLSMQFNPDPWNQPDVIGRNNCLAYALDEHGLGWPFLNFRSTTNPNHDRLRAAFESRTGGQNSTPHKFAVLFRLAGFERIRPHQYSPDKRHIIAFSTMRDHYFRLDSDGTWSHKPGPSPARNRDDNGDVIECLERAVMKRIACDDNERVNEERSFNLSRYRNKFQPIINEQAKLTQEERQELGLENEFRNAIAMIRSNKRHIIPSRDEIIYLALPAEGIEIIKKQSPSSLGAFDHRVV